MPLRRYVGWCSPEAGRFLRLCTVPESDQKRRTASELAGVPRRALTGGGSGLRTRPLKLGTPAVSSKLRSVATVCYTTGQRALGSITRCGEGDYRCQKWIGTFGARVVPGRERK